MENTMSINTPKGPIVATIHPGTNHNNPGISLQFQGDEKCSSAVMEYSPEAGGIQLHVSTPNALNVFPMSEMTLSKEKEELLINVLDDMVARKLLTVMDKEEHTYGSEMFVSYDAALSSEDLAKISLAEDPADTLSEILAEMEQDYADYEDPFNCDSLYCSTESRKALKLSEDAVNEWLKEHVDFTLPYDHFLDQRIKVNVMLATKQEENNDFVAYNCMNYYGSCSYDLTGRVKDSALLWIADQFGKRQDLLSALCDVCDADEKEEDRPVFQDSFINSCIQELDNFSDVMGGFTLLLDMSVLDFVKLREMQNDKEGYLIVKKETMCGIFDPWHGSGSVLEIELPDELKIPTDLLWSVWIDGTKTHQYDVDEVYGLIRSCWKDSFHLEGGENYDLYF